MSLWWHDRWCIRDLNLSVPKFHWGLPRWHSGTEPDLPMQETQETWVRSQGREDPLEDEIATHSSILAWRIPWIEKPGGLQSTGSQRVRRDWATENICTPTFYWDVALTSCHLWLHHSPWLLSWREGVFMLHVHWATVGGRGLFLIRFHLILNLWQFK